MIRPVYVVERRRERMVRRLAVVGRQYRYAEHEYDLRTGVAFSDAARRAHDPPPPVYPQYRMVGCVDIIVDVLLQIIICGVVVRSYPFDLFHSDAGFRSARYRCQHSERADLPPRVESR